MWAWCEMGVSSRSHEVLVGLEAHHLAARKPDGTLRREVKGKKRPFVAQSGPAWALLGPHSRPSRLHPLPHRLTSCIYLLVVESPCPSSPLHLSGSLSLPLHTFYHPSVPLPPPFQPFFFGLLPTFHTPERPRVSESRRLSRCFLEIRLSTSSSSTSSTSSNTPGCVLYTYDRVYDRETNFSSPFRLNTNPYVWGWEAHQATQMCWLHYAAI